METNWAKEHLQVIRTLMERSALYRRALAPVMLYLGVLGVAGAAVGLTMHVDSVSAFGIFWLAVAGIGVAGAFVIARRQAIKDKEDFWSPPTRRVGQAMLPSLTAGMFAGLVFTLSNAEAKFALLLAFLWILLYGCALHAAGFFMARGIRWFGWVYIGGACALFAFREAAKTNTPPSAHWLMGFFFGALHLAYGAYLYWTENRKNAA